MRSDSNLSKQFSEEGVDIRQYGVMPGVIDTSKKVDGNPVLRSHSFSGKESNSVFWNQGGEAFKDISGVTGLDSLADGRAFAFFDFDRDGRNDVILTNTNEPQLQLFRNEIEEPGNAIRVKLVGGNLTAQVSEEWSPRDGIGAHVLVEIGEKTLRRELRAGDGFAAQNSETLLIGIGNADHADEVTVFWPSGKKSEVGMVKAGELVTIDERVDEVEVLKIARSVIPERVVSPKLNRLDLKVEQELNVVVTLATWCPVCQGEIKHFKWLSKKVEGLGLYAFPIDEKEGEEEWRKFEAAFKPPYKILREVTKRGELEALMEKNFGETPLPSSFILDKEGRILKVMKGTPTLSDLRSFTR